MPQRPMVQIIGDGANGRWLTWRWSVGADPAGESSGPRLVKLAEYRRAVAALRAELPDPARLAPGASQQDKLTLGLRLNGGLTTAAAERELMRRLSEVLLPAPLRAELVAAAAMGEAPIEVRVAPSPGAACVPWGLLPIDDDRRLLEIADVSWIGPVLPRDTGHLVHRDSPRSGALKVVNPGSGQRVIDAAWEPCQCFGQPVRYSSPKSLEELRRGLADRPSRLLIVGHCHTDPQFGEPYVPMGDQPLSASWLVQQAGQRPMPPRVGIVACASGTDMSQPEPFGLGVGALLSGAELVHLTLWTLPTDEALRRYQPGSEGAFERLAQAFDHALGSPDPVAAMNRFQREQLANWRADPGPATSPLFWGSAITMTCPLERNLAHGADPYQLT